MGIVSARSLVKTYRKPGSKSETFRAVDGVSLDIEAGQIFGILGPNGAGKTTTLEMLEGLTDIDEGAASIDGIDVTRHPSRVKEIIGVQLQANEYFDHLSLADLLRLFSKLFGRDESPEKLLARVNLQEKAKAKPATGTLTPVLVWKSKMKEERQAFGTHQLRDLPQKIADGVAGAPVGRT